MNEDIRLAGTLVARGKLTVLLSGLLVLCACLVLALATTGVGSIGIPEWLALILAVLGLVAFAVGRRERNRGLALLAATRHGTTER